MPVSVFSYQSQSYNCNISNQISVLKILKIAFFIDKRLLKSAIPAINNFVNLFKKAYFSNAINSYYRRKKNTTFSRIKMSELRRTLNNHSTWLQHLDRLFLISSHTLHGIHITRPPAVVPAFQPVLLSHYIQIT